MARKLLFIVNPRSGKRNSGRIIEIIKNTIGNAIDHEIGLWTNILEFNLLAKKLKSENFTDAIAVGGDGSVNLVAQTILNTGITLGIVPTGSGNGLARSLGISVRPALAVKQILEGKTAMIDSGEVNGHAFFCTSGVGFDAHIGGLFANLQKRGLKTYIKLIARELLRYKPQTYTILAHDKEIVREAFFITVANAGQFGNNFYVAPGAKLNDGLFNIVIVKPFKLIPGLLMILKILRGKADKSRCIETFAATNVVIKRQDKGSVHFDGEPAILEAALNYQLKPGTLKALIGSGFNGV